MIQVVFNITWLVIFLTFPIQAFAGAPTTSIIINGPGISREGIKITDPAILSLGGWPGNFMDSPKGAPIPAAQPASNLPRYVLAFYVYGKDERDRGQIALTALYVWDPLSNRALVYMPGPSDLGYQLNYYSGIPAVGSADVAGKWFYAVDPWARAIRKALPQNQREH